MSGYIWKSIQLPSKKIPPRKIKTIFASMRLKIHPPSIKKKVKKINKTIFVRMRLEIHRVQAEDFTSYKCVAKNSLGETDGKIRLFGKIEPFHEEKNNVSFR